MRARFMAGAAALLVAAAPLTAQRAPRTPPRGMGAMLERQVEAALDRREALGLTEAQVAELETLRSEIEATVGPVRSELDELRSQARDRSGDRDEVRARMQAIREEHRALRARMDTLTAPLQSRFEQAVPPLQRRQLQELARRDGVDGRRGRGGAGAGLRGMRGDGPRGVAPGGRGDRRSTWARDLRSRRDPRGLPGRGRWRGGGTDAR